MPANSIAETRSALATAFSALSANIYPSVPESPIPPAIVVVPDSPYMEVVLIGKSKTQVKLNFAITAIVASNSNAGSLDNLEQLIIGILAAMPAGYVVGVVEKPTVLEIGQSPMLVADINVSTYYTQTN
jgi:hypothetical protein